MQVIDDAKEAVNAPSPHQGFCSALSTPDVKYAAVISEESVERCGLTTGLPVLQGEAFKTTYLFTVSPSHTDPHAPTLSLAKPNSKVDGGSIHNPHHSKTWPNVAFLRAGSSSREETDPTLAHVRGGTTTWRDVTMQRRVRSWRPTRDMQALSFRSRSGTTRVNHTPSTNQPMHQLAYVTPRLMHAPPEKVKRNNEVYEETRWYLYTGSFDTTVRRSTRKTQNPKPMMMTFQTQSLPHYKLLL